jgi:hypothetical protein
MKSDMSWPELDPAATSSAIEVNEYVPEFNVGGRFVFFVTVVVAEPVFVAVSVTQTLIVLLPSLREPAEMGLWRVAGDDV